MRSSLLPSFALLFLSSAIQAGEFRTFTAKHFTVSLPDKWKDSENLFGLPYVFLGPKKLSKRATLSVVPAVNEEINLSGDLSTTAVEVYQLRRILWVEKHQGEVIKFNPYVSYKGPGGEDAHQFGFKYKLGKETFAEDSYYFYCGKTLINLKSIVLEKDLEGQKQIESIVSSVRCR